MSAMFGNDEGKKTSLSLWKIVIGGVWVFCNVVIFLIAPIFIVTILLIFEIPLNMTIVTLIYVLGAVIVGLAGVMAIYNYSTKERAIAAVSYTGVLITFLIVLLTHLGGDSFALIRVDIAGATLYADVTFFASVILGTVIGWGGLYAAELIVVFREVHKDSKQIFTMLKAGTAACVVLFLLTASFFMILMVSAMRIGGSLGETPAISYNNNGTPLFFSDDTLDFTYNISILNGGSFRIQDITFTMYLYLNSTTSILLTPGVLLGSGSKTILSLEAGGLHQDTITIGLDPSYLGSFVVTNNTIRTLMFISANVIGLLPVAMNMTGYWTSYSIFYPQT